MGETKEIKKFGALMEVDPNKAWVDQLNDRSREIASIDPNPIWDEIRQGKNVYMVRFDILVYIIAAGSLFSVIRYGYEAGVIPFALLGLATYIYSDLKGGITHVVLDEAANIGFPVIGPAALEFQMHHAIPQDNVIKPYVQMCGDLNMYACVAIGANVLIVGPSTSLFAAMGFLVLFGYLGQWAHRATHMLKKNRPQWTQKLQSVHLLLPAATHAKHHQTYDGNYPILNGWTGTALGAASAAVPNRWFWLAVFSFITLFDGYLFTRFGDAVAHAF